jgi:hypothetical protein
MMREKAFKVYYTKGLICSSKPVENCTKPVDEKSGTGSTRASDTVKAAPAGIIRAFILKIRTALYVRYRLLKRMIFTKKTGSNGKKWEVIYRAYKHFNH